MQSSLFKNLLLFVLILLSSALALFSDISDISYIIHFFERMGVCGFLTAIYCYYNYTFFVVNSQSRKLIYPSHMQSILSTMFFVFYFAFLCVVLILLSLGIASLFLDEPFQIFEMPMFYFLLQASTLCLFLIFAAALNHIASKSTATGTGKSNREVLSE
ncbi:hypothetical protein [Methanimicrococcus hacksteinii]|nr:hypothetical protein [Methanimicrococcus sp. At1]